jgi:4-oxalocrotonate tautomerase
MVAAAARSGGSQSAEKMRTSMPEIMVYCAEGRTAEQKKSLMKDLTDAMVKNFDVPADVVTVQIVEAPKANKAKGGIPFTER